jgi:CBS domain-containing membrane protein
MTHANPSWPHALSQWLQSFWPAPVAVTAGERLRVLVGGGLGIGFTAWVCHALALPSPLTWIIAPMGASAVLVFGVPASPLAQPWSVVGGNTLSALVAVGCVRLIGPPDLAVAAAVALAIGVMFALRCLHPPGGATALLVAVSGVTDPSVALVPVLLNSVLLVGVGIAYNNLTRRAYPHRRIAPAAPASAAGQATESDLDAVLARYNQVLDVSRDDLRSLVEQTQVLALDRRLAEVRCADIMSRKLTTVEFGTPLGEAWALLNRRRVKALPVVDKGGHVVGIVTKADFLQSAGLGAYEGMAGRWRSFLLATGGTHSDKPEVVGQIMTRRVRVTSAHRHLADLVPLLADSGHHHIPVIADGGKLVGMITQSDVVIALAGQVKA